MANRYPLLYGVANALLKANQLVLSGADYIIAPGVVTPAAHAASHGAAGTDPVTLAQSQVTGLTTDLATLTTGLAGKEPTITVLATSKGGTGTGSAQASGQVWLGDGSGNLTSSSGLTFNTSTKVLTVGPGSQAQALIVNGGGPSITSTDILVLKSPVYPYFQLVNTASGGATTDGLKIGIEATRGSIAIMESGWPIDFYTNNGSVGIRMTLESSGSLSLLNGAKFGSSGTVLTQIRVYTPNLTPANVAANTSAEEAFAVAGLSTSDTVIVNPPGAAAGVGLVGARVSAANTLALNFGNFTGGALAPPAGVYRVIAIRS